MTQDHILKKDTRGRVVVTAERRAAPSTGRHQNRAVVLPEHAAALWKMSLQRETLPPPSWRMGFTQEVASRPLEKLRGGRMSSITYEQKAGQGLQQLGLAVAWPKTNSTGK